MGDASQIQHTLCLIKRWIKHVSHDGKLCVYNKRDHNTCSFDQSKYYSWNVFFNMHERNVLIGFTSAYAKYHTSIPVILLYLPNKSSTHSWSGWHIDYLRIIMRITSVFYIEANFMVLVYHTNLHIIPFRGFRRTPLARSLAIIYMHPPNWNRVSVVSK